MTHDPDVRTRPSAAPLLGIVLTAASAAPLAAGHPAAHAPRVPATAPDTAEEGPGHVRSVDGEKLVFPLPASPDRPLMVLDSLLADRIESMARRSRKWREALRALRARRFPVLVGTVVQVERELPALEDYAFDGPAAAWIFSDDRDRPVAAAVTVNLPMLIIRSRILGDDGVRLRRMLELHLAHEIYGHLAPIVATGDPDHPCRLDPSPADPAAEQRRSCVMRRESQLLEELGYEPRDTYLWDYWEDRIERRGPGDAGGSGPRAGRAAAAPSPPRAEEASPGLRRPNPGGRARPR